MSMRGGRATADDIVPCAIAAGAPSSGGCGRSSWLRRAWGAWSLAIILCAGILLTGILGGAVTLAPGPARAEAALTLVMVDDPYCRFCRKFDAEIAPGYAASPQGKAAPLVGMRRASAPLEALGLAPANFTPTFILVRGRREVGRITGYPGADYFYDELGALLEKAGSW